MAIETFNPHEAHVGGQIIITMEPVLVSNPVVLIDISQFVKVKIGGKEAKYEISPNRDFIFCTVPAGLKVGQQCEIEVDDSGHQFRSTALLTIIAEGGGQNPGDGVVTVTGVNPTRVDRVERDSVVSFNPPKINLVGTNLDLVTKVTLDNISIANFNKTKTRLSFNLPKTLEAQKFAYKIRLTYGNENRVLNTGKTIKVSNK